MTPSQSYLLTVVKAGTGSGALASVPLGIDCGSDCNQDYKFGTGVTLTATANMGSTFTSWSVDGAACPLPSNGGLSCSVTMTQAWGVTATFTLAPPPSVPLTIARAGSAEGTVSSFPAGISCGVACNASFAAGTVVTLSANPAAGAAFREWRGACTGSIPTCGLTLNASAGVIAVFSKVFTDDPLVARSTAVKAVHFQDLRSAIDMLRARQALAAFDWTTPTLIAGSTPAQAQHLLDLRSALTAASQKAGRGTPSFAEAIVARQTIIKASHLAELRAAVRALE
jgi:hypothetical protein